MSEAKLDVTLCRGRQARLPEAMARLDVPGVIVTQRAMVQWLTGAYFSPLFEPAAALLADGTCILVKPLKQKPEHAADEVVDYEAQWHSTLRNDQRAASSAVLVEALARHPGVARWGVEYSSFPLHLSQAIASPMLDIEPTLFALRRRKDADELAMIRHAIAATGRMYAKAREILRPGITELEVFNTLQSVAVDACGEMLTGTGNDYRAGARGGPPRSGRRAAAGELYILDLGPAYRGYFADNCRTIAVDARPTDAQLRAQQAIVEVLQMVEREVRPGVRCREIFERAQAMLDASSLGRFDHHLGHGIGLFPHEGPHLNPHWDDTFAEGDVFTAEPGLYDPTLQAGIRLENDYLVTASGVENLSPFPLEL